MYEYRNQKKKRNQYAVNYRDNQEYFKWYSLVERRLYFFMLIR